MKKATGLKIKINPVNVWIKGFFGSRNYTIWN